MYSNGTLMLDSTGAGVLPTSSCEDKLRYALQLRSARTRKAGSKASLVGSYATEQARLVF